MSATKYLGESYQVFTAQVKTADGSLQTYKYSVNKATGEVHKLDTGLKESRNTIQKTSDSIFSAYKKMLLWGAAATLIYKPIEAFRNALETMKKVDSELVTIQKVTILS